MSTTIKISIVIAILSVSQIALGQRRGFRGGDPSGGDDGSGGQFQRGGRFRGGGGGDFGGGRFQRGGGDPNGGGPGGGGPGGGGRFQRGGPGGNGPMSSDDIASRISRYAASLKNLDANGNGSIDADEASDPAAKEQLSRIFARIGKEPHYPVAISQILQDLEASLKSGGAGGPPPSGSPSTASTSESGKPAAGGSSVAAPSPSSAAPPAGTTSTTKRPTHFPTARERLPKGLPDWFLEKDVNGEGQITMAQFATEWTPEDLEKFNRYDLNHDGIITAAECLKVEKGKANAK